MTAPRTHRYVVVAIDFDGDDIDGTLGAVRAKLAQDWQ